MLRSDTISSSTQNQDSAALSITDIEKFFQVIVDPSYDSKNIYYGLLTIFRKNFLEYLHYGLRNKIDKRFECKKRMLHDKIKFLIEKQFFQNKIDEAIIQRLQQSLADPQNKLFNIAPEEDKEDLLTLLRNMNDTSQILNAPTENNIPFKIQSGMTQSEKRSITYNQSYQAGSVPRNLNNQGIKHFSQSEWQAAIGFFEAAIVAESEITSELNIAKDVTSIAIYQRNIANAYHNWALDCQAGNDFLNSVQWAEKAIQALDKIPAVFKTKNDEESRVRFQRTLSYSTNGIGILLFNNKSYFTAINYFILAITRNSEIPNSYMSEIEEINLRVFLRNIAYTYGEVGVNEYCNKKFELAIINFQFAIATIVKIPEPKVELEQVSLALFYRNVAITYNARGLEYFNKNQFKLALENFEKATQFMDQINPGFLRENDKNIYQVYKTNYQLALKRLEPKKPSAFNPCRLFKATQPSQQIFKGKLKRIRSEQDLEQRPMKRIRSHKSEPELRHVSEKYRF